jgi:hypothetical protein
VSQARSDTVFILDEKIFIALPSAPLDFLELGMASSADLFVVCRDNTSNKRRSVRIGRKILCTDCH